MSIVFTLKSVVFTLKSVVFTLKSVVFTLKSLTDLAKTALAKTAFVRLFNFSVSLLIVSLFFSVSANALEYHPITGESLAKEQVFTYRLLDESTTLDPQLVEDVNGASIVRDLFEGLLNQDADGGLTPGVALSWVSDPAKKIYVFTLRRNAKWSNGEIVKAQDFVYSWRRAVDPSLASPYAWFMELAKVKNASDIINGKQPIESLGITALDDFTLKVELSEYLPYFPQMMTHSTTFPAHRATIEKYGNKWVKPGNIVSNGAYILVTHVPNERSVRVRNKKYWNNANTIIDKTIALIINDENQALTRYLAGELDRTEIPAGQYPNLKKQYPEQALSFPRLCNYYYIFNLSDSGLEAFKDVRVRKAMSLAIDRKVIVEKILAGGQFEAYTFTPEATDNFKVPKVEIAGMTQKQRDKLAKKLLQEAGYGKTGKKLSFEMLYNTSESHKKIAVVMSQMWKQKLGIEAKLANIEWKVFLDNRSNQNFSIARGAWCGDYNEASTFLDLLTTESGYNDGKFSNLELDSLMKQVTKVSDTSSIYTRVEQIIAAQIPIIPIYHYAGVYMLDKYLRGWPINNVEQNWYSRDLYKVAK